MDSQTFGLFIKARRKALLLDQVGLAKRVGLSLSTLQSLEQDRRRASPEVVGLLARHLELSPDERMAFEALTLGQATPTVPPPTPTNLSAPLTSLIDRIHDLAVLSDIIARPDVRLLSILGPPGIGKTRLGIAVAGRQMQRFPGGVWFVDLSVITHAERVLPAIARVLDVAEQTGQYLMPQIAVRLRQAPVLIVLDNFEHIVDDGAPQVTELLMSCPLLKIIITSRTALNVYGEFEYLAPPLSTPPNTVPTPTELQAFESAQLFVARARQHTPEFAIDQHNATHIADICIRLEGIALAIELAAARVRHAPPVAIAAALHRSPEAGGTWLHDLDSHVRERPVRQQRLVEAIRWSFDLLPEYQQRLLARLGVFIGSFDTRAVIGICTDGTDPGAVTQALAMLTAHNLIQRDASAGRWRLLVLIREFANGFARAHLALETNAAARLRHTEYYANWALQVDKSLQGADDQTVLAANAADIDNLGAALRWAVESNLGSTAFTLCEHLGYLWELRGDYAEGLRWIQTVMALPASDGDEPIRRSILWSGLNLAWMQLQLDVALGMAEAALTSARTSGDQPQVCGALMARARVELEMGRAQDAVATSQEMLELALSVDKRSLRAANCLLGEAWLVLGDPAQAVPFLNEAVSLPKIGDEAGLWHSIACAWLTEHCIQLRDFAAARAWVVRWLLLLPARVNQTRLLATVTAGLLAAELGGVAAVLALSARLWGAVNALNLRIGGAPLRLARQQAEPRVLVARRRMGRTAWDKAFGEGATWSPERIVAEVKGLLG